MLKHQREKLIERARRRADRASARKAKAAGRDALARLSDRLKAARQETPLLTAAILGAIEVLLLRGRSVEWVARETGVTREDVAGILARLAITARARRVDYLAARLTRDAPDPLPRLYDVDAGNAN